MKDYKKDLASKANEIKKLEAVERRKALSTATPEIERKAKDVFNEKKIIKNNLCDTRHNWKVEDVIHNKFKEVWVQKYGDRGCNQLLERLIPFLDQV